MSVNEERFIQRDRMRFTKNTLSSGLALLAILFNVIYFVSIYKSDVGSYYYNIIMGASILYNLIFMLVVFLSSEGVKSSRHEACEGTSLFCRGVADGTEGAKGFGAEGAAEKSFTCIDSGSRYGTSKPRKSLFGSGADGSI